MVTDIATFRRLQHLLHGPPNTIRCDRAYDNNAYKTFCAESETTLLFVAANEHEADGLIGNSNRTLRLFFNLICLIDQRTTSETVFSEAVYGKNISSGSKRASKFYLLYGRWAQLQSPCD